jgi:mannose-1-phosphate guanylyltransferase
MKVIIFAGGVGTRLWPLSRKNTPKQFEKIIGDKTMLQIAVGKLFPLFNWDNIYIATGKTYVDQVKAQLPELPVKNIIVEPEMRDVGPAVGLVTSIFHKTDPNEPIVILWGSDHLVREEALFQQALKGAEEIIKQNGQRIVFIGQKPRFANQNLGYIEFGEQVQKVEDLSVNTFKSFLYRPHLSMAEKWVKDGHHAWNLGYFVTTPKFLWALFNEFAPKELNEKLEQIQNAYNTDKYEEVLSEVYPTIEKITFDNAVLEKMDPKLGLVISTDLGWSDIGAWEALKEALSTDNTANVTKGDVAVEDSTDSLVYNFTNQLVVAIDLKEMIVVNTKDVVLICPKNSVPKIKKFVQELEGTEHENLA